MFIIQTGMEISAVQSIFNSTYPYLKLEFFIHRQRSKGPNKQINPLKPRTRLAAITVNNQNFGMKITEDISVIHLDRLFQDHFGLSVQVFRRSGKSWLETTVTDDWTLKKQNEQGKELSSLCQL